MKRTILLAIAWLSCLGASPAMHRPRAHTRAAAAAKTQQSALGHWSAEPDSFMGIVFGVPVQEQCEECAKDGSSLDDYLLKGKNCFERLGPKFGQMQPWHHPDVGIRIFGATYYFAQNDTVAGASVEFYRFDYAKFLDLLTARYGAPGDSALVSYENAMGGTVQGRTATWMGPKVTMILSERSTDPDNGNLAIRTSRLDAWAARESKLNAEKFKDKL